ncbi:MAG: xanthine permease [Oscillospiraceae bacterium]|jgi:uracil permease|nr:xanthine permease [Oscillospiraceae bacterium]
MSKSPKSKEVLGYLPDESPSWGKLIIFAFQQVLVMFPATVTVALLTGFHVSTTIFASGLATICFLLITRSKIPLYYGSSFSYIAAIVSVTGGVGIGQLASDDVIAQAQFGIIMSGFVSIVAGLIVSRFGMDKIEKVLPPTITGPIAAVIGLSLAGTTLKNVFLVPNPETNLPDSKYITSAAIVALVTLLATILFSVYLKGVFAQLPILFGILVGYCLAIPLGLVDFSLIFADRIVSLPHFTLPKPNLMAVAAIMPIALATIPESSAHLFQLDIYVNDLAKRKGKGEYKIKDKLGLNLIGDGIGDIVSAAFGGPAGTNYGENISTMAITKNFSVRMLKVAAIISMVMAFFSPLSNAVNTVPSAVINGACIFLFGVIAAQGIAIMISQKVDMFDARNLAVISVIFIIGIGGTYVFDNGMIPAFGFKLPAIATAAVVGIVLNLLLLIGKGKKKEKAK